MNSFIVSLILNSQAAVVPTPPKPPVYVPICIPGHPKCNRPYPPITVNGGQKGKK